MTRPLLLDLFCGAGGAAVGYHRAGFDVYGVDIVEQPLYPFPMEVRDALELPSIRAPFVAVHASPPCQAHVAISNRHRGRGMLRDQRVSLIAATRDLLRRSGLPYVIENVTGARRELVEPVRVCHQALGGTMHRHRLFESNVELEGTECGGRRCDFAVYGKAPDGRLLWRRADGTEQHCVASLAHARELMGMPWASWRGCCEAIPPAYAEHIGRQLLAHLQAAAA